MKNVLSFIFGVALGGSILFWGPQNGHLSEYDPAAIENSIGSISHPGIPADTPCPYLQGKMGQSAGTGQSACPYLNEMKDKTKLVAAAVAVAVLFLLLLLMPLVDFALMLNYWNLEKV
jgi:hypothetical protein